MQWILHKILINSTSQWLLSLFESAYPVDGSELFPAVSYKNASDSDDIAMIL